MGFKPILVRAWFVVLASASLFAQQNTVGTWQIDLAQSNFGADPAPKSMTSEILVDTPEMLSYRAHRVNADGSSFGWEWSGPKDGSVRHPKILGVSSETGLEGVKEENGDVIWHGIELDGSLFEARNTLSTDANTMAFEVTWKHYDGTQEKQKWVFRRATNGRPSIR